MAPVSTSHVGLVWPVAERVAERLIVAHRLSAAPGARVVVRWLALNVAVAARGGWPAPLRLPRSLARELSAADRAAIVRARVAITRGLAHALGYSPDDPLALDDGAQMTIAAWLTAQCDDAVAAQALVACPACELESARGGERAQGDRRRDHVPVCAR
jgi:hypothetical protein